MKQSDVIAAARRLHELGLDPFHPSEETVEFSQRPEMPSPLLTELDRIGIHQQLLLDEIHIRFWHHLKPWPAKVRLGVHASATVLALKAAGLLRSSDFASEYRDWGQRLHQWVQGPLAAADARLAAWLDKHDSALEDEYQPASTLIHLVAARRWMDLNEDLRRFKRGFVLAEEHGVTRPMLQKHRDDLANVNLTGLDVLRMLNTLHRIDPSLSLSIVGSDSKLRTDPYRVRDALDKTFGIIHTVREDRAVEDADLTELVAARTDWVSEHAINTWCDGEDFRDFLGWLGSKQRGDPHHDPFAILLHHMDEVLHGEQSTRSLAKRYGIGRGTLAKAWREVDREIRRRLWA